MGKPSTTPEPPQFISRINAARLADCNPQLIDKLIKQGKLRRYGLGHKVLVAKAELLALLEGKGSGTEQ